MADWALVQYRSGNKPPQCGKPRDLIDREQASDCLFTCHGLLQSTYLTHDYNPAGREWTPRRMKEADRLNRDLAGPGAHRWTGKKWRAKDRKPDPGKLIRSTFPKADPTSSTTTGKKIKNNIIIIINIKTTTEGNLGIWAGDPGPDSTEEEEGLLIVTTTEGLIISTRQGQAGEGVIIFRPNGNTTNTKKKIETHFYLVKKHTFIVRAIKTLLHVTGQSVLFQCQVWLNP